MFIDKKELNFFLKESAGEYLQKIKKKEKERRGKIKKIKKKFPFFKTGVEREIIKREVEKIKKITPREVWEEIKKKEIKKIMKKGDEIFSFSKIPEFIYSGAEYDEWGKTHSVDEEFWDINTRKIFFYQKKYFLIATVQEAVVEVEEAGMESVYLYIFQEEWYPERVLWITDSPKQMSDVELETIQCYLK